MNISNGMPRRSFLKAMLSYLGSFFIPWVSSTAKAFQYNLGAFWKTVTGGGGGGSLPDTGPATLWVWGVNQDDQLGLGDGTPRSSPVQYGSAVTWTKVAIARSSTCEHGFAIQSNGDLWAFGLNLVGQLGTNDTNNAGTGIKVGNSSWADIAAGSDAGGGGFSVGIKTGGTLWAWGLNDMGQLGQGVTTPNKSSPTQIGTLNTWSKVTCGDNYALAIKTDGTLLAWGENSGGQLGNNAVLDRSSPVSVGSATWADISASSAHTAGIRTDGTLWVWGRNNEGQLGQGTTTPNRSSPIQVGNLSTWSRVVTGYQHVLALRTDGTLWSWGANNTGQLGLAVGDFTNRSSPTQIGTLNTWVTISSGNEFCICTRSNGMLWSWGYDNSQLGVGTSTGGAIESPVQVGTLNNWLLMHGAYSGGNESFYGLQRSNSGSLWGWGSGGDGSVGDNAISLRSSPVAVGTLTTWSKISFGASIDTSGKMWCWGPNDFGRVGDNTTNYRSSPTQVGLATTWTQVASGMMHTLALRSPGTLWAWGNSQTGGADNGNGALGQGLTVNRSSPVQIGAGNNWTKIAVGGRAVSTHFSAGIRGGGLYTWGTATSGKLGQSLATNRSSPVQVGNGTGWTQVSLGTNHGLGIRSGGLYAWGQNSGGCLGDGSATTRSSPVQVGTLTTWYMIGAGEDFSLAMKNDGTLWAFGSNFAGQLGVGDGVDRSSPVQVGNAVNWYRIAASRSSFGITTEGKLYSWGENSGTDGALGQNTTTDTYSSPTQVGTLTTWLEVASAGNSTTFGTRT